MRHGLALSQSVSGGITSRVVTAGLQFFELPLCSQHPIPLNHCVDANSYEKHTKHCRCHPAERERAVEGMVRKEKRRQPSGHSPPGPAAPIARAVSCHHCHWWRRHLHRAHLPCTVRPCLIQQASPQPIRALPVHRSYWSRMCEQCGSLPILSQCMRAHGAILKVLQYASPVARLQRSERLCRKQLLCILVYRQRAHNSPSRRKISRSRRFFIPKHTCDLIIPSDLPECCAISASVSPRKNASSTAPRCSRGHFVESLHD